MIKATHNESMRRRYPIIGGAVNESMRVFWGDQRVQEASGTGDELVLEFLTKHDEAGSACCERIWGTFDQRVKRPTVKKLNIWVFV